jgi:hypothetical protein
MATTVAAWAEDRAGRKVELLRREAERAAAAIPALPAARELGRSVFLGFERSPRPWLLEVDAPELTAGELRAALEAVRALPPEGRGRVLSLVAALGCDPARLLASAAPSPGEARKLVLALGLGGHAWAVLLDEPTNHLDLPSIERLEAALAAYPGALLMVTHDPRLAARCTRTTWRVAGGRVEG